MNDRHAGKTNCAVVAAFISLSLALPVAAAPAAKRPDPYAAGMRQVQRAIANGDLDLADKTTLRLSKRFHNNPELLSVRARVLFWQKRFAESIALFRRALQLKPAPELRAELDRVLIAQKLAEADQLASRKQNAQAEKILVRLFEGGKEPYESGLRLARVRMSCGDYRGASDVLTLMLQRYPRERDLVLMKTRALLMAGAAEEAVAFLSQRADTGDDAELLALRGRALMRLKRYDEAAQAFTGALALSDDAEVRGERERAETASLLERADRLSAAGDTAGAGALLRGAFEAGRDRYGTGTRLAALYTRSGAPAEAAKVYLLLMSQYPKDTELAILYAQALANSGNRDTALRVLDELERSGDDARASALRGRILLMKGQYQAAEQEYEKARRLGGAAPELAAGMGEARAALDYHRAQELLQAKDYRGARPLLDQLAAGGPYARQARVLTVKALLALRDWDAAAAYSGNLYREDPQDPEFAALHAEALLRSGERREAREVLDRLDVKSRENLLKEREDLFFGTRVNWVKLYGGLYNYSRGYGNENVAGVTVSQRFRPLTALVTLSETTRFKRTDPQLALELYQARRGGERAYGSVSFSAAPGAEVLPRYTAGAEGALVLAPVELSLAWNWLKFKDAPADADFRLFGGTSVFSAAATWYLPGSPASLGERVYFAPENSTAFAVTTLRWQPTTRLAGFASAGAGNSSERIVTASTTQDLQRYTTYSFRTGAEYRISPAYSVGGEGSFESRRGLYDHYGATLFFKYWWP